MEHMGVTAVGKIFRKLSKASQNLYRAFWRGGTGIKIILRSTAAC